MKRQRLFLLAAGMVLAASVTASAQVIIQLRPDSGPQLSQSSQDLNDDEIIRSVFDPVTEDLKLTPAQRLRVVTIASAAMITAEPFFSQLDDLDDLLSIAAFTATADDARIKELSARQAVLLGKINVIMARAKGNLFQVLTEDQRQIVINEYRSRQGQYSLGSISNTGP